MKPNILFDHPMLRLESFDADTLHGEQTFVRMRMPDWANVIPITDDDEVVLVRQHRWGINKPSLELPGGVLDLDETPTGGAARELLEETGYGDGTWESLGSVHPNPAIQDNRIFLFYARGVRRLAPPSPDPTEELSVELHPISTLPDLLDSGAISHALCGLCIERWMRLTAMGQ